MTISPGRRARFWLGFAAGLAIGGLLGFGLVAFAVENLPWKYLIRIISQAVVLTTEFVLPIRLGIRAALATIKQVRHEAYELVCLTNLSNWQIVWMLFETAYTRLPSIVAFMAGLSPLGVILAMMPSSSMCTGSANAPLHCLYSWRLGNPVNAGLFAVPSLTGLALLTLLATWVGLWLGLWWRKLIAIGATVVIVITIGLSTAYIHGDDLLEGSAFVPLNWIPQSLGRDIGVYIVVPTLLLAIIPFLAARSARKQD